VKGRGNIIGFGLEVITLVLHAGGRGLPEKLSGVGGSGTCVSVNTQRSREMAQEPGNEGEGRPEGKK